MPTARRRIVFENLTLALTADSAEAAYSLLDRALRESCLASAEPALTTTTYVEYNRSPLDPLTLREGSTTDLY